ncbi:hypothetical protein ACFLYY_00505 [Patescibacteria group bacterium]
MKKIFLLPLVIFLIFGTVSFISAQRDLEVDYPDMPGGITPTTVEGTKLPDYVKYIFNFAIGISGLLAVGVIVFGGARYTASAGNPTTTSDAKEQIIAGIAGLIILLSSWLILTTINPQLVIFEEPELLDISITGAPGVWLCEESLGNFYTLLISTSTEDRNELNKSCYKADIVSNSPDQFNDKAHYYYLVSGEGVGDYGAILFEDANLRGKCQIVTAQQDPEGSIDFNLSSIVPFKIIESPRGDGVVLYRNPDFNILDLTSDTGDEHLDGKTWPSNDGYFGVDLHKPNPDADWIRSISISRESDISRQYIAVAMKGGGYSHGDTRDMCEVFDSSDHELLDDYIGTFCGGGFWSFLFSDPRRPCLDYLRVLGGEIAGRLK